VLRALLAMERQSWEQGVASHAALDLHLDDLTYLLAHDAIVRQSSQGQLGGAGDGGLVNCAANGEAVHWAAQSAPDGPFAIALRGQVDFLMSGCPRDADGTLFHIEGTRQVWVDTVYMVVPFLCLTGHVDEAVHQLRGHRLRLFDTHERLYAHSWDGETKSLVRAQFWGTGNGWVAAGLARALRFIDAGHDSVRIDLALQARDLVDRCLAHRRRDDGPVLGVFGDVLDDPESFEEANVAQMLAYACLTGVADGWLPPAYGATGRSLLAAADQRVDAQGLVRKVCGAPHFDHQGVSAEAQAFNLLAHAASARLG
jgi:unsaturated rhamnogalacturonyl hydrolase